MNPGTIIIIIIGIIGLLIYATKKRNIEEKFAVLDHTELPTKSSSIMEDLKKNTSGLFSLFATPDLATPQPINMGGPSLEDLKKYNESKSEPNKDNVQQNNFPTTLGPVQDGIKAPDILPVPETALPVMEPPLINNNQLPPTISDEQGKIYQTPKPIPISFDNTYAKPKQEKIITKIVYVPQKCPPMPDMSKYIRKDAIPCWGCNLK